MCVQAHWAAEGWRMGDADAGRWGHGCGEYRVAPFAPSAAVGEPQGELAALFPTINM